MLIFIQGSDSFLARSAINKLKTKYLEKNPDGTELVEIDCDPTSLHLRGASPASTEGQAGQNWADLAAVPLFATSRLAIIKGAGLLDEGEQGSLAHYLKDLPETTVAVVWDQKPLKPQSPLSIQIDNRSAHDSSGNKAAKKISADLLVGAALEDWIKAQATKIGAELTPESIDELVDQYGSDLWAIQTDLQSRQGRPATSAWSKTGVEKPFILFDYVRARNWPALKRQLIASYQRGEAVELTIGALAAAIRKHVSSPELKLNMTETLADVDIALKSGLIEPADATALLACYLPDAPSTPRLLDSSTVLGVNGARSKQDSEPSSFGASQKRVQWEVAWEQLS